MMGPLWLEKRFFSREHQIAGFQKKSHSAKRHKNLRSLYHVKICTNEKKLVLHGIRTHPPACEAHIITTRPNGGTAEKLVQNRPLVLGL